jgi:hypothetical protein
MIRFAFVALAAGLAAGCSHATHHGKPSPCARARAEAVRRPTHRVLRGDVDGDGSPDRVSLVRVRRDWSRCGAFLVVRAAGRTLTHAVPTSPEPIAPSLTGLAALGPGPGLRIVVTTWEGASTAFARIYSVRATGISLLRTGMTQTLDPADDTFPYEGSVTHFNAVDCVRPGVIIASGWFEKGASGTLFGYERRLYRVGATVFEPIRSQTGTTRTAIPPSNRLREFREPQPFPSCMRVRAEPAR